MMMTHRSKRLPWPADFSLRRLVNRSILKRGNFKVISHPRSGRTWLLMMLHELSIDPRHHHAGAKKMEWGPDAVCRNIPEYFENRILFLLRDPRDTIVSYFHHCKRLKVWDGDLPGFVRNPNTGFERLLAYNLGWLEAQDRFKGFAAVRYEDLRQNPESELARIIGFFGCRIPASPALANVVAGQAFEHMKRNEIAGGLHAHLGKAFPGTVDDNERLVRRGVVGGHVDEMEVAEQEFCQELLGRYDYDASVNRYLAGRERGQP